MFDERDRQELMLSLSGEFLVAGELLRREIACSITYGEQKAGIILKTKKSFRSIEVRTTRDSKWNVDNTAVRQDDRILVLVHLPRERKQPPEFFILNADDIDALAETKRATIAKVKSDSPPKKNLFGIFPLNRGFSFSSVMKEEVEHQRNAWDKITSAIGHPRGDWRPETETP